MNIADFVGAPVQDPPDETIHHTPTCSSPAPTTSSPQPEPRGRKRAWLIAVLLGAVALGALAGWAAARAVAVDQLATPVQQASPMPAEVANTAEIFIARYLSGQITGAETLYTGDAPEPTGTWINHTAAVAGTTTGNGIWEVTVAVDSLEPIDDVFTPVELRYFVVPISTQGGRTFAVAAPSLIPNPGEPVGESRFDLQVPPDQATTAARFLEEYLTAGPEIARYVSVPSPIDVFSTAPYVDVKPTMLGADSLGRIKASVTATNERNVTHRLEYVLTLSLQSDVWVVSDLGTAGG